MNEPTFFLSESTVTARDAEYSGTPFLDEDGDGTYNTYRGCNRAASNAPGIGIATFTTIDPLTTEQQITLVDQFDDPRTPQNSQHIGATGYEGGLPGWTDSAPIGYFINESPTPDADSVAYLVVADQAADPGNVADTVTGAINVGHAPVVAGDILWGAVP